MNFNSKKSFLIISGITSVILSRLMFAFFDDPEGPNLLVVFVMAGVIYTSSFIAYKFFSSKKAYGFSPVLLSVLVQIIFVIFLYFCLR